MNERASERDIIKGNRETGNSVRTAQHASTRTKHRFFNLENKEMLSISILLLIITASARNRKYLSRHDSYLEFIK